MQLADFLAGKFDRDGKMITEGYMVSVSGKSGPSFVHTTREAAVAEARRLMDTMPTDRLQIVSVVKIDAVLAREPVRAPTVVFHTFGPGFKGEATPATEPATDLAAYISALEGRLIKGAKPKPKIDELPPLKPFAVGEIVRWESTLTGGQYGRVVGYKSEGNVVIFERLTTWDPDRAPVGGRAEMNAAALTLDLRTVAGGGFRKLEVGKRYVDTLGQVRRIVRRNVHLSGSNEEYESETSATFDANGVYSVTGSAMNLVAEYRP